jgi:hypothetical protein
MGGVGAGGGRGRGGGGGCWGGRARLFFFPKKQKKQGGLGPLLQRLFKIQHSLEGEHGLFTEFRIDEYFVVANIKHPGQGF